MTSLTPGQVGDVIETAGKENVKEGVKQESQAAKRAISKFPRLAPKTSDIATFVEWIEATGSGGVWVQDELYEAYLSVCQLAELDDVIGPRKFGNALAEAGYSPWQSDKRKGSKAVKGTRIMMVDLSKPDSVTSKIVSMSGRNGTKRKPPKSIGKLGGNPLTRKPVRRVAYQ
jgi:hypothetical protein